MLVTHPSGGSHRQLDVGCGSLGGLGPASPWACMKLKLQESLNSGGGQAKQQVGDSNDGEEAGHRAVTRQVVQLTEGQEMGSVELLWGGGPTRRGC